MSEPEKVVRDGTTASIDERLKRVEKTQGDMQAVQQTMQTDVALLKMEQTHIREYFGIRLQVLENSVQNLGISLSAKIDKLTDLIAAANVASANEEGARLERIKEYAGYVRQVGAHEEFMQRTKGQFGMVKILAGTNLLAALAAVAAIAKAFNVI